VGEGNGCRNNCLPSLVEVYLIRKGKWVLGTKGNEKTATSGSNLEETGTDKKESRREFEYKLSVGEQV